MIVEPLHPQDAEAARSLYLEAFPEYERADWDALVSHSGWGDAELLGLYDGGLVGMSYVIFDETVQFVLYLAVDPSHRGAGAGSEALRIIENRFSPGRMFLNIEPPDEECSNREQRVRRLAFYERNGFSRTWVFTPKEGESYLVMCKGEPIIPEELDAFGKRHRFSRLFGPE